MKWRILMGLALLAILFAAGVGIWAALSELATGNPAADGRVQVTARGFSTVFQLWPVALAGAIAGGVLVLMVAGPAFSLAQDADHENQRHRLRQQLDASERRAINAEIQAQQRLQARIYAAEVREREASAAIAQAKQYEQALEENARHLTEETERLQDAARHAIAQAQARAEDAEKRRRNAAGTAERLRRRLEKRALTAEPWADEVITDRDIMEDIRS
ncbi:hypothetical protein R3D73_005455 [Serratia marcescens]|nr:hypothetical protein [Serratia marcescens]ELQ9442528.1 hypothetical protein [Serratia marcescens]ELT5563289.1 hypothetical protein [Serratia marcescens]